MPGFPGKDAPLPKSGQKPLKSNTPKAGSTASMPGAGKSIDIFSTARTATPKSGQKSLKSRP